MLRRGCEGYFSYASWPGVPMRYFAIQLIWCWWLLIMNNGFFEQLNFLIYVTFAKMQHRQKKDNRQSPLVFAYWGLRRLKTDKWSIFWPLEEWGMFRSCFDLEWLEWFWCKKGSIEFKAKCMKQRMRQRSIVSCPAPICQIIWFVAAQWHQCSYLTRNSPAFSNAQSLAGETRSFQCHNAVLEGEC